MDKKFKLLRSINLSCPVYITTNNLPKFQHEASINTRLEKFPTKELPVKKSGVNDHFQENAIEHLHWIADQITRHRNLLDDRELFYENQGDIAPTRLEQARNAEMEFLRTGNCQIAADEIASVIPSNTFHPVKIGHGLIMSHFFLIAIVIKTCRPKGFINLAIFDVF